MPDPCPNRERPRFTEAGAARRAADYISRVSSPPLQAYRCRCGGWHLRPRRGLAARLAAWLGFGRA